jgi:hypothetical protein
VCLSGAEGVGVLSLAGPDVETEFTGGAADVTLSGSADDGGIEVGLLPPGT